jgi:hypothetical protein
MIATLILSDLYPGILRCSCELRLQPLYVVLAVSNMIERLYWEVTFCLQKNIIF